MLHKNYFSTKVGITQPQRSNAMPKKIQDLYARRVSLALTDRQHRYVTSKKRQKERGYTTANHFIRDLIDKDMKR